MAVIGVRDLSVLDPANNEGYGTARLPCGRDEEIASVVRRIDGPSTFEEAKRSLSHGHGTVLSAFAERMSSLSVRTGSMPVLREGLIAEQLALTLVSDQRDSLPVLSLLFRAAEILDGDPVAELKATATVAPPPDNLLLLDFPAHDPEDRSLASMGYVEVRDDLGFRFERSW